MAVHRAMLVALSALLLAGFNAQTTAGQQTQGGNTGVTADPQSVAALLAFKDQLSNGGSASALNTWKQGSNPCSGWTGVTCGQGGNIIGLDLTSQSLQGPLAPDLSKLSSLTTLRLGSNSLSGPIPEAWGGANGAFSSLTELDVSSNQLDGALPAGFSTLGALKILNLSGNGFTGPLPSEWGTGFGSLQQLLLSNNKLTGALPTSWGTGFSSLQRLDVSGNTLTGTVPPTWSGNSSFPNLATAGLIVRPGNDQLCGALPTGLASKVAPPSAVTGNSLQCGGAAAGSTPPAPAPNTPPAPAPDTNAPTPAPTDGQASPPRSSAPTRGGGGGAAAVGNAGSNNGDGNSENAVVGAKFAMQGQRLVPFTNQYNETTASAIKAALGSQYSQSQLQYIGSIPTTSSSQRRQLLQSASGIDVYYDIQKVANSQAVQSRLQSSDFAGQLQGLLNQNGVPANSVRVSQVSPGGITIPGQAVTKKDNGHSLSTGAIIGIAVGGAVLVAALLLLLCCCCCLKRRKRSDGLRKNNLYGEESEKSSLSPGVMPTFRANDGEPGALLGYQQASPKPIGNGRPFEMDKPIILDTDETTFRGQPVNLSPKATSQQGTLMHNPVYNVAPTDGSAFVANPPPPDQENKLASWWGNRKAAGNAQAAPERATPAASPFSPQIQPQPAAASAYQAPGGGTSGGGRGVAEWLRPDAPANNQTETQTGRNGLPSIVTDIRNI